MIHTVVRFFLRVILVLTTVLLLFILEFRRHFPQYCCVICIFFPLCQPCSLLVYRHNVTRKTELNDIIYRVVLLKEYEPKTRAHKAYCGLMCGKKWKKNKISSKILVLSYAKIFFLTHTFNHTFYDNKTNFIAKWSYLKLYFKGKTSRSLLNINLRLHYNTYLAITAWNLNTMHSSSKLALS